MIWIAGLVVALLALAAPVMAAQIEDFFGKYEGETVSNNEDGIAARDIGVTIRQTAGGFNVTWTTVIPKADGELKRSTYSIDFRPTRRENLFGSAMRTDMFGNRQPLNPLKGDPYVWATLRGDTLTVYALLISDDGRYEMQTYERTLDEGGLHLEFSRIRDGLHQKYITGFLERVD